MHKIDRSARNLHDWASVGDLIDNGIQVHFAHESLDMTERGGRLSADIQAVMASDYVRNLRQETIKGINGRLNQGLYPFCAPIGYLNTGKGSVKLKDPDKYELVQELFSLYSTGEYNAKTLSEIMYKKGLRNFRGNRANKNSILRLLKNPFYIGLLSVNGNIYSGIHEPIVSKRIFQRVQSVSSSRTKHKGVIHDYLFRKRIRCILCKYMMIGERQKGNVYYRCATKLCSTKTRREDFIDKSIKIMFDTISFSSKEKAALEKIIAGEIILKSKSNQGKILQINFDIDKITIKENKLLEAYLENLINSEVYQAKKNTLADTKHFLEVKLNELKSPKQSLSEKTKNFLELSKSIKNTYDLGNKMEKRNLINIVTSNLSISGKSIYISLQSPFKELVKLSEFSKCTLNSDVKRTTLHKNTHLDNADVYIANEWTTQIKRPTLSKKKLIEWCDVLNESFDFVPKLEELLYPDYKPD